MAATETAPAGREISSLDVVLRDAGEWSDELIARFCGDYGTSEEEAGEIFLETKRWLWFCARCKVDCEFRGIEFSPVPLLSEALVIDLMWHTFLLFTREYGAFCERHFGFFVHHRPMTRAERAAQAARSREDRRVELKRAYESVYDVLGPATLRKWCEEFSLRFPPARFNT